MTNHNQKKQEGISPVVAAGVGAVVGASVAVAGAVVLQDEKNREKVKDAFGMVKDQAVGYIDTMQQAAHDKKDEVVEKVEDVVDAAKKAARK